MTQYEKWRRSNIGRECKCYHQGMEQNSNSTFSQNIAILIALFILVCVGVLFLVVGEGVTL